MTEADASVASDVVGRPRESLDRYTLGEGVVTHELGVGELSIAATISANDMDTDPKGAWWSAYLAGNRPEPVDPIGGCLRAVDLFCGAGGLANGVRHLCDELGVSLVSEFIADQDEEATVVYAANHSSRRRTSAPVQQLIDSGVRRTSEGASFAYPPELLDEGLGRALADVDLVLAGPPCQGHSNLNNQTRRTDPRNDLYLAVPAFAVAVCARMCIIENVPAILKDAGGVVEIARDLLEREGYHVTTGQLSASQIGWPQTRKRHFLVARRDRSPLPLEEVARLLRDGPRPLWWIIHDLEDSVGDDVMGRATELSAENQARIDWLFDNHAYELALDERPRSHRNGTTYMAVYGRMRQDEPAPTITTGFMSPGRGRYVHPTRRRVLTAREAARLQGFPDDYRFVPDPRREPSRSQLAKWIGDAVPMPLGYAAALSALGGGGVAV